MTRPDRRRPPRPAAWTAVALLVCTGLAATGCVQRRMTVRTNPPGAIVYVDNVEIGTSPVAHDFLYYGTREIRLVKAGYETLTVKQPIPYAWYQIPPLDFISDNLTPWEIRDERDFTYQLVPAQPITPEEVRARGEQLRRGSIIPTPNLSTPPETFPPATAAPSIPAAPPFAPPPPPTTIGPAPILPNGSSTLPGWTPSPNRPRRVWPTP